MITEEEVCKKLDFYGESIKKLVSSLKERNDSLKQLEEENNKLSEQLNNVEDTIKAKDDNIDELNKKLQESPSLREENDSLLARLEDIKKQFDSTSYADSIKIKNLENELAAIKSDNEYVTSLEAKLKKREEEAIHYKKVIDTNYIAMEENMNKFVSIREELNSLTEENKILNSNLIRAKHIIEDLNKRLAFYEKKEVSSDESLLDKEIKSISKNSCILSDLSEDKRNKYDLFLAALYTNNLYYDEPLFAKKTGISEREVNSFMSKLLSIPGNIFTVGSDNKVITKYQNYSSARSAILGITS